MTKIGFIGTGNMATAIVKGFVSAGAKDTQILAYDIDREKAQQFADLCNGKVYATSKELAQSSDYLFLAVKPQNIEAVLGEIKGFVKENTVIVSIIAGLTSKFVKESLGFDAKVVPVMPNTPLLLGCGAVALSRVSPVSEEEYDFVKKIFAASGQVCDISEDKLKEVIPINGSSPAFIYLFAKYFVDFAVESGIDENTALALFSKSLEGSAKMLTESGYTIDELIKMVSSPGGTTIAGLEGFYQGNLEGTVKDACQRCVKRAYELSK